MKMQSPNIPRPPGLAATLAKGFDAIATHITIILLPVLLDLFLWLGPKLRLQTLLEPLMKQMTTAALPVSASLPDPVTMQQMWSDFLTGFNMLSIVMSLTWFGMALVAGTPLLLVLSILLALSPAIAQVAMFMVLLFGVWMLMPVFFSPHGIYIYGQNAFAAIMQSLKLIRFTLPSSGTFLLVCLLINEGLGYLWAVPPQDSWLTLIAIIGHGFVSTALVASTFIYYREVNIWLKIVMEKLQALQKPVQPQG